MKTIFIRINSKMENPRTFVIAIGILTIVPIFVSTRDLQSQQPILKLYEVDGNNNILRPYNRIDNERSEVIIEKLEHLRLECRAYHPVEWIYTGNKIPILSSNISLLTAQARSGSVNQYIATAFISPLKEHHTGNYQCSHTEYLTQSPYLYIYVPGQSLFTSLQGKSIQVPRIDTTLLLPCSVSHPRVKVSLEIFDENGLRKPVTKSNNTIVYDPRKGFRVNLNKIEDPEGTYVCVDCYNNRVKTVDYTVISKSARQPQNLLRILNSTLILA